MLQGGDGWSRVEAFYAHMCHVNSLEHSASRTAIVLRSAAAAKYGPVILMAHNGPLGLGKQPHDICGVDWRSAGGGVLLIDGNTQIQVICFIGMSGWVASCQIKRLQLCKAGTLIFEH